MIKRCRNQVRVGFGGAYGLDFGAVLSMAEAMGAASPLLADLLPDAEAIIVSSLRSDEDGDDSASADKG